MNDETDALLRSKINLETALFPWQELLRYFAAGHVLVVAPGTDLIEAATHMAQDNVAQVGLWLKQGSLAKVSDAQAQDWLANDEQLWTVVVKPWIVVQQHQAAD